MEVRNPANCNISGDAEAPVLNYALVLNLQPLVAARTLEHMEKAYGTYWSFGIDQISRNIAIEIIRDLPTSAGILDLQRLDILASRTIMATPKSNQKSVVARHSHRHLLHVCVCVFLFHLCNMPRQQMQ